MALRVDGVSVTYGPQVAVDDVTLEVSSGEILALLGPSGCGKSTLLRAIAGLEPVRHGVISYDATDLAAIPLHRRGFGLMFQDGMLFPQQNVGANVGYGLRVAGMNKADQRVRVLELLEVVGLGGFESRQVATLSGGQAQRVALARALAPTPRLMLLDEPLAALDKSLRESLLIDLGSILRTTGTSAIFVTHDQGEAFGIADSVALMNDGRIRQQGAPREVWDNPVDEWVARFVGYTSVLPASLLMPYLSDSELRTSVMQGGDTSQRMALRPNALRPDPAGLINALVQFVTLAPDHALVRVDVRGWGNMTVLVDADSAVAPGEHITLRLDSAGCALIP
ncbi:ABC transporter ATP-binding protein [Nakamurella antarctica]|uniref:ABC-type quaternary amine transporter n=1 Tax=Nakamurella antarctica TaxID=1902245 RepID=A0A3G8ZJS3_9ACTN|nr:ABC transporter ATP-binding protein [Nakamurella antarctica]AZI57438.1 ABC transporter ATP-binding protein [Nakamurella antarctica]